MVEMSSSSPYKTRNSARSQKDPLVLAMRREAPICCTAHSQLARLSNSIGPLDLTAYSVITFGQSSGCLLLGFVDLVKVF